MVISVRQKNVIYSQLFLKMRKFLLDMRKDFLIMSNFYLVEILSEPNSFTIVTSKKILKMSKKCAHFKYFFLIMRIRNLQCILTTKAVIGKPRMLSKFLEYSFSELSEDYPILSRHL